MSCRTLTALLLLLSGAGCASPAREVVPSPRDITLDAAMRSVVTALRAAETESRMTGDAGLGLNACTVTVTFNIRADGTAQDRLILDTRVAPVITGTPVTAGLQAGREQTLAGSRGNQISILLTTPACNPADTLGTVRPNQIGEMARQSERVREQRRGTLGGASRM